jgi:hypothetical protein
MKLRALLLSVAVGLALTGCSSDPRPVYPEITYAGQPPIALDVATVEVVDAYRPPLQAPNVDHLFPVSLSEVVGRWAKDRLRAVGADGTARLVVEDASVVQHDLPVRKGVTGLITTDQEARFDGRLAARLEIVKAGGLASGFVEAEARRSQTVAEGVSLEDRDKIFFRMAEHMAKDLDRELEAGVRQHLAPFIR